MEPLRWVAYRVGYMVRETGQALERLGNRMQNSNAYLEPCAPLQSLCARHHGLASGCKRPATCLKKCSMQSNWNACLRCDALHTVVLCGMLLLAHPVHLAVWRHRTVFNLVSRKPVLGSDVFVAPSAAVIGSVKLGDRASVWYGTVLRGARCLT